MNLRLLPAVSALLLVAPIAGQDMAVPKPAPELKRYDVFVGTWKGEGKATGGPGMTMPWRSTTTYQWILGGHVMLERTRIEFDAMAPLFFTVMHAWNPETKRYMMLQVGNDGSISSHEVHWADAHTMVYGEENQEMGQVRLTRWVSKIDGDTVEFTSQTALGAGDYGDYVSGTMKRISKDVAEVEAVNAAFMPMPGMPSPAEHMGAYKKMAGTYHMKGWFAPPGMPKTDIASTESVRMLFGDTVCEMRSKGEPHPAFGVYEGLSYLAWNDRDKCFDIIYANNMGEVGAMQCHWISDTRAVATFAGTYMGGQPVASSGVVEVDDTGAMKRHWSWMIMADGEPKKVFEASYTKMD